ncbi:GAF domain-containing protein [Nafulsella turpanensis]|uniref:GAF domain-containing protein n=1 Tax=Nafulsella turpanensis TaxID=1265690 RepID=UPI000345102A|nr:GAF domain-containing protein [Nafulsella turpanensis]
MSRKYNLHTFSFHFILIYAVAALISLLIIISYFISANTFTIRYNHYASVVEPLKYQIKACNIEINKQAAALQAYSITGEEKSKKVGIQLLNKKLPERIQLMRDYAAQLNDPMLESKISEVEAALLKFQLASQQITYPADEQMASLIKSSYAPEVERLSSFLKDFNAYLYDKHSSTFNNTFSTLNTTKYWTLLAFILLMGLFYFVVRKTRKFVLTRVKTLEEEINEIAAGNIPAEIPVEENELSSIIKSVNTLVQNLRNVKEFSLQVGKGDFDTNITVFDNEGELGNALAGMRQSLKEVAQEDKKRHWVNAGLTQFHSIIRQNNTELQELCFEVLSQLIKYIKVNQGGVFILHDENGYKELRLEASYAYNRKKFQEKVLAPGQGLVGQAYLEQDKIYLKEIPKNYVHITSGLGDAPPTTLLIQPLKVNEQVVGVIELAAFYDIEGYVQDFIEKVAETLASAVANAKNNSRNRLILEESQSLAEQLRAQEEELRQNTEELQATQEEMERRIRELEAENQRLKEPANQ